MIINTAPECKWLSSVLKWRWLTCWSGCLPVLQIYFLYITCNDSNEESLFLMQLPSKSSSHPPRPSDLSHGLPLRRIDNEERRGTCLVANGWWMALGKDIAFTWWTSREDDWGWRARPFAVQCNRNNIYNNLSTAFICDAPILVGFSCSLTGSANDKPATRVPWTWKWGHSKEWHHLKVFLYLIEFVVCRFFSSISMTLLGVLQKNEERTLAMWTTNFPLHTFSSWSPVEHD